MKRKPIKEDGTSGEDISLNAETSPPDENDSSVVENSEVDDPKRSQRTRAGKAAADAAKNKVSVKTPAKRSRKAKESLGENEKEGNGEGVLLENGEVTPKKKGRQSRAKENQPPKHKVKTESSENELANEIESEAAPKELQGIKCTKCMRNFKNLTGLKNHLKKCVEKEAMDIVNEAMQKVMDIQVPAAAASSNNNETPGEEGALATEDSNSPVSQQPSTPVKKPRKIRVLEEKECHCCGEDKETAHKTGDFQCYHCNKLFVLKASLERHQRVVHLGESHECPQCGAKCPDKGTLARHMYTHTGFKPYSCPVCKQEFSRKYHLVRHNMQTGCDGKARPIFPCQVCGREFNRKDNLREHLRAHAGQTKRKKVFTCDTCGLNFCGTHLLLSHKRTHAAERMFYCDFCPKRFVSNGAMKKHRRTHTGERPFECSVCGKKFAAKETLNRHMKIHTGHKPHVCRYCGKRFIQSSQLKSHLFYHTGQGVFQPNEVFICELCGKSFNRRARLNEHTKYIHLGAIPFECEVCKKTFIRKEDLNRHSIIHTGIKEHKCPICSKAFAMKSSLKVHLLTHTKEPPRSCDECGRAFIRQDCLLRHMRTKHRDMLEEIRNEAEKKKLQQQLLQPNEVFTCELCEKSFNRRARLNEHTKYTHLRAIPFECEVCKKTFIRKDDLNRHSLIHTGIKEHKCPICSKAFAIKSSLKVHLLAHNKEPPRSCDVCGRAFIRQDCLLRHMRTKHRDMLEEIRNEAERKKKLQQQLLQVAAEASLVEGLEERGELGEKGLVDAVSELLGLLVDEATLKGLGWPTEGVESVLESVIRRCGHDPAPAGTVSHERLRHYIKLLFTVVIDDSAINALLDNQTIDQVILHVLRQAKSYVQGERCGYFRAPSPASG